MRMTCRLPWLWITFLLRFILLNSFSEARHHPSAAVLVGTVYCDTCFHQDFSKTSHFISGASVAVECGDSRNGPNFRKEVKTDDHGEFKVHLPLSVSKHVKKIKGCSVKLISSSGPYCVVASSATSSSIHLKERKEGKHIFSAGFFTFKPLNQPELCNQKPSIHSFKQTKSADSPVTNPNNPAFLPPIQGPPAATPLFPPVPGVPQLPGQLPAPPIGPGNPMKPTAASQEATFSKHSKLKSKYLNPDDPSFFPPIQEPPTGLLHPIIRGGIIPPLPELPPLPGLPGLPSDPPVPKKSKNPNKSARESQVMDEKIAQPRFFTPIGGLPPNPLLLPPSVLPPNPLSPPLSILPLNPLLPPPSQLPLNPLLPPPSQLPANPLLPPRSTPPLIPSPPSVFPPLFPSPPSSVQPPFPLLPSPSFPTPLPRFPFQPTPPFPGVPPAATSTQKNSP